MDNALVQKLLAAIAGLIATISGLTGNVPTSTQKYGTLINPTVVTSSTLSGLSGSVFGSPLLVGGTATTTISGTATSTFGKNLIISGSATSTIVGDNTTTTIGGSLGIGTTGPASQLHVYGTAPVGITISNSSFPTSYQTVLGNWSSAQAVLQFGNNGANEIRFGSTAAGGAGAIYTNNTAAWSSATNGNLAMYFAANGSVGVGTTGPGYTLDVSGGFRATATSTFSGNVGIGTTQPSSTLHVVGGATITGNTTTTSLTDSAGNKFSTSTVAANSQFTWYLDSSNAILPNVSFPATGRTNGTNVAYNFLAFPQATDSWAFWQFPIDSTSTFNNVQLSITGTTTSTASSASTTVLGFYWGISPSSTIDSAPANNVSTTFTYGTSTASVAKQINVSLTSSTFTGSDIFFLKLKRSGSSSSTDTITTDFQFLKGSVRFY